MKNYILLLTIISSLAISSNIKELTNSNFQSIINDSKPTLVKFYAPNCHACEIMKPHFKKVSKEFGRKINYAQVDISKAANLREKYYVIATPTTIIFKNGKEIDRAVGGFKYNYLKQWSKNILNYFKIN